MTNDILRPEIISRGIGGPSRPPIELLAGAWLAGYASPATRRAYRSDLQAWLRFCQSHDIAPFEARRSHVELFARNIEQRGCKVSSASGMGPP